LETIAILILVQEGIQQNFLLPNCEQEWRELAISKRTFPIWQKFQPGLVSLAASSLEVRAVCDRIKETILKYDAKPKLAVSMAEQVSARHHRSSLMLLHDS